MKTITTIKKTLVALLAVAIIAPAFTGCKKGAEDPMLSLKSRDSRITGTWELVSGESTTVTTTVTARKNDVNGDKYDKNETITTTWNYAGGEDTKVENKISESTNVVVSWNTSVFPMAPKTETTKINIDRNETTVKSYTVKVSIFKDNTYTAEYTETSKSWKLKQTTTTNTVISGVNQDTTFSPANTRTWTEEGTWMWADSRKNKVMIDAGPLSGSLLQLKSKELIISDATNSSDDDTTYDRDEFLTYSDNTDPGKDKDGIETENIKKTTTWSYSQTWEKTDKESNRD